MTSFFLQSSYRDFDEFSHVVQAWDLDFRQLDRGDCRADLMQLASSKCLFSHARFNRLFEQRGSAPPGTWTFAIFAAQSTPIVWHEQEISTDTIVIYRPGAEIDCVSRPGFEVFTLSYSEKHLNRIGANLGLPEINKIVSGRDNFECKGITLIQSKKQLNMLTGALKHHSLRIPDVSIEQGLGYEVPEQILLCLSRSGPERVSSLRTRNRAIKKIKQYLAQKPREPVTVSQLCRIAGVSERTLQYGFLEHFGVTPKAYLKSFRLNSVRRGLWNSDPGSTKVNDVASLWGFWHMGQFAADYRKLFGELPSETLQRRK